jgi:hypothetical protein
MITLDPDKKKGIDAPKIKQQRDNELAALVHDFGDGRIIQTRSEDESNIRNAIEVMESTSLVSVNWRMEDNSISAVTTDELKIALASSQLAAMSIWADYNSDV